MAEHDQARLVRESLIGVPHDTYRKRAPVELDLVSIELSLISAQARAAGLAGIDDNSHPAYADLVGRIDACLVDVESLKALRS